MEVQFTHYWVKDFGWENTIFGPEDFIHTEFMGQNEADGNIFIALDEKDRKYIFKGVYLN